MRAGSWRAELRDAVLRPLRLLLALAAACLYSPARAESAGLEVFPAEINLTSLGDRQSVVVQAVNDEGVHRDVTADAMFRVSDERLVRREANVFYPRTDGRGEITVALDGREVAVPLRVEGAAAAPPVSFRLDVMPVLMKAGCNSGSCHGAARGQDGFRLSLFGYDPDGDYFRMTREWSGRRLNLAVPEESLLLTKAVGAVPHTGGRLFAPDSESYQTVLRWIEAMAPDDPKGIPRPVRVEVLPSQLLLQGPGANHRLTVRAHYADGTDRDVTSTAVFLSNNDTTVAVSDAGVVTVGQGGEAFVMARFESHTVGVHAIVIPPDAPRAFPPVPEHNYIDALVHAKLRKLRIAPSEVCSDGVFLRRVYLDLVGRLPEPADYRAFVGDSDPGKRVRLVDDLLARKEFVELWVMKWAELLQIRSDQDFSYKSAVLYHGWLKERIAAGEPIGRIVSDLLSATGGTFENPATNYYQLETDTLKVAENAAQVFMGIRMQCAQCHNHPFDRWTMDDYYSFAAFFSQIGRKKGEDPRETIVFNSGTGEAKHPVTNRVMAPRFLGAAPADLAGADRREALARWLTAPDNPYFARNLANITWTHFFGRGIVEPVDDVRISNPPSNPALLDELGRRLAAYEFDFRLLVRDICRSRTYQLSTRANATNAADERNFSRAAIRRLRAEVLLDCIAQVTETPDKFKGLPRGARAVQIADGSVSTYFLTTFGRARRETVCSCEVVTEPTLSQALHLLNGDTVHRRIRTGKAAARLLEQLGSPEAVLDALYLRCLTRPPTDQEKEGILAVVQSSDKTVQALEDVFWALLNSKEFIFNH